MEVKTGDPGERDNRRAQRAVGHWRGVGDERQPGGLQGFEAELNEDRRRHGHRCSKPGSSFKKRAERKCDQDHLHALIGRERAKAVAQHLEQPFLDCQLIEENQVEDDPADGKEAVKGAVKSRRRRGWERHAIGEQRDGQCHRQAEQRRAVDPDMKQRDGRQQHHNR